jgi:hypothetical protein
MYQRQELYISANNILNKRESERIIEINTGKSGTRSGFYCDFYVPKTGLHISSSNISKEKERDCGFYGDKVVVFNATFNNISTISWRPVLVVEEVGVPRENHQPWASNMDRDKMSILYKGPSIDASYQVSVHLAEGFQRRRLKCEKLMDDGSLTNMATTGNSCF